MYVAILHEGNRETPITADEYKSRFGARGGHSTWLTCPECGQPVVTRAMSNNSSVSPYFKHENDNPVSWECPNYVAGGDYYSYDEDESVSLGEPTEMYIERESYEYYLLEAGFPAIDPWAFELLKEQGAIISFGDEDYEIDDGGFGDFYTTRIYGVDGPSFGLGLELKGAIWPYDTPLPNIEHTLNGCMLFESLDAGNFAERLNARNLDLYDKDWFLLVYSTIDGMGTALLIEALSEKFKVTGAIDGSEQGEHELRVAEFFMTNRDVLKMLFP